VLPFAKLKIPAILNLKLGSGFSAMAAATGPVGATVGQLGKLKGCPGGGKVFDAVLPLLNVGARVPVCQKC